MLPDENVTSTTSYRVGLEGVLYLLKYTKLCGITSTEVEQWCENLRMVHSTNEEMRSPKDMGKPNSDILLAMH